MFPTPRHPHTSAAQNHGSPDSSVWIRTARPSNEKGDTGAAGAPKKGDKAAWGGRGNIAALVASAVKGKGGMPPKGGNPSLTDADLKAAIEYMTK